MCKNESTKGLLNKEQLGKTPHALKDFFSRVCLPKQQHLQQKSSLQRLISQLDASREKFFNQDQHLSQQVRLGLLLRVVSKH
jgi:hypothetical protein